MRTFLKIFLISGFFTLSNAQNVYESLSYELQQTLDSVIKKYDVPGITFSLRFDEENSINLASGFEDDETLKPLPPNRKMLSGSVGKIFFSTVALKLIENNELGLDDKVMHYLGNTNWYPTFPNSEHITVMNLMNHTSGLPRHLFQTEFLQDFIKEPKKRRLPVDCIQSISNKQAIHPVGQGWAYSDTNYILLGLIIEKITNEDIYDLVNKELISSLNLNLTVPSTSRKIPGLSQGHIGNQNPFQLPQKVIDKDGELVVDPSFEWTGGGFATNPQDLTRLVKYIYESDYLKEDTKALLKNAVNMATGEQYDHGYGLGTFVWCKMNDTRYGHSGFFPGYVSHVEYSTNRQYAIAIQVNYDGAYPYLEQITYDMEKVVDKYLDKIDESIILKNFKYQEKCWNNGDLNCYMNAYSSHDEIQTASRGGITYGFDNILANYKKYFPKDKMGQLYFDNIEMRRLKDDLYHVTGRFNLKFDSNNEPTRGWFSATMKKIYGKWFMITDHSS